jgi:hypothetical protein
MKTGRRHMIPMGSAVREVLELRRANGLYFPNRVGEPFAVGATTIESLRTRSDSPTLCFMIFEE